MAAWGKQQPMMGFQQQSNRKAAWSPPDDDETALRLERMGALLAKKLGPEYLSQRAGGGGGKLTYIEGWRVINLANEVFGFNGWSTEVKSLEMDFVDYNEESQRWSAGVTAVVRVTLADGAHHEDVGYGKMENCKSKGDAIDKIKKEAVTDATKRALRSFGNILGNCIYDKNFLEDIGKLKPAGKPKFSFDEIHRPGKEWPDPVKKEMGMKMEVDGEPSGAAGPKAGPSNGNVIPSKNPVNQPVQNQNRPNPQQGQNVNNARPPVSNNNMNRPQQAAQQANTRPPVVVPQHNNRPAAPQPVITNAQNVASTSKLAPAAVVEEANQASEHEGSEGYFDDIEDAEFSGMDAGEGEEADDSGFVDTVEAPEAEASKPNKPMQNPLPRSQPNIQIPKKQEPPLQKPIQQQQNQQAQAQAKMGPQYQNQAPQGRTSGPNIAQQGNNAGPVIAPQPQKQNRALRNHVPVPQARGMNVGAPQSRPAFSKPPSQPIQATQQNSANSTYLDGGNVEGGDMLVGAPPADGPVPVKVEFEGARVALKRGIEETYDTNEEGEDGGNAGLLAPPPKAAGREMSPAQRYKLQQQQRQPQQNQVKQKSAGPDLYKEKREAAAAAMAAKRAKTTQGQSSGGGEQVS